MEYSAKPGVQPNEWIVTETDGDLSKSHRVVCAATDSSEAAAIALVSGADTGDPVIPLEALKVGMEKQVDAFHAKLLRDLTGDASAEERDTWVVKAAAAKAVVAASADAGQEAMLTAEGTARGMTLAEMAMMIEAKDSQFKGLVGLAAALRVKGHNLIAAATSEAELAAIIPQLQTDAASW